MKRQYGKLFVLLTVLLLCMLLPMAVFAQTEQELSDYVDIDFLDRYLQEEFEKRLTGSGAIMEIPLSEFRIPDTVEDELLLHIRLAVPEIVLGLTHSLNTSNGYVVSLRYQRAAYTEQTRAAADMLMRDVENNNVLTDVEKALILHDRLAIWTDYPPAGTIISSSAGYAYGALINRSSVCEGYARAYQYLLTRAGVRCDVHVSTSMDHAWNAVWIDGVSYMVDVTWDDGSFVPHEYFLVSDDRYLQVDGEIPEPYGTTYDNVVWPDRSLLVNDKVYGLRDSILYRLTGLQMQKVTFPGVDKVTVEGPCFEVGSRLVYEPGDWLMALDLNTGETERLWRKTLPNGFSYAMQLDYDQGRLSCDSTDGTVYPFADKTYTVTFQDWNGTVLQSDTYEYGQIVYAPEDPTRSNYVFTGWDNRVSVCAGDTVYTAQYAPAQKPDGWVKENGHWYYMEYGYKKTGWHREYGNTYYLNYAGIMETGLYEYKTTTNYSSWQTSYYYFNENGAMQTGWKKLSGSWYYFQSSGEAATGWQQIGGRKYFFLNDGTMKVGALILSGQEYYLDENIGMITGWKNWGTTWSYYATNGVMVTGWKMISGHWYYFDQYGVMQTGWLNDGDQTYYLHSSGAMAVGWAKVQGKWYYFNSAGHRTTGWKMIGGIWYYFGTESYNYGHMMANEQCIIGGKTYGFDASGAMVTGWLKLHDQWFYFDASGAKVSGWKMIGGKWYYFKDNGWGATGIMTTGSYTVDGVLYYFGNDGAMCTGWIRIAGAIYLADGTVKDAWCYANSSGAIQKGWQKIGGNWYYFNEGSSYMATGRVKIDGQWYTFSDSGVCQNR